MVVLGICCRMNFLSNILREEGGFEYKKAIVDSILILIREIPDAKESGLSHLCEFIEDCEFTYLSTQVSQVRAQISLPQPRLHGLPRKIQERDRSLHLAPFAGAYQTLKGRRGSEQLTGSPAYVLIT